MSEMTEAVEAVIALLVGLIIIGALGRALSDIGYLNIQRWTMLFVVVLAIALMIVLIKIGMDIGNSL